MNIRNTVIVVGAGASAEFGLPSGESVMNGFRNYTIPSIPHNRSGHDNGMIDFSQFLRHAPPAFMQDGDLTNLLDECVGCISAAAEQSIDILAFRRPEFSNIGRMMTTWRIFQSMHAALDLCTKPFVTAKSGQVVPNWLAVVSDLYCGVRASASLLSPEKLTFVTFNYDPLIEVALRHFLEISFPSITNEKIPRIIHIHGKFEPPPYSAASHILAKQAANIRFVLETEAGNKPEVEEARNALRNAHVIYCVGFAFNALNRDLVGLDKYPDRIVALNYDGHEGVTAELQRIGVPQAQIIAGTIERPLCVGEAARRGFFGRLPEHMPYMPGLQ